MKEKYVFLINASEPICKLNQQILKEAGIISRIEDYTQNAYFNIYGANSLIGKKITVPKSQLDVAKKILNISNDNNKTALIGGKKNFRIIVKILASLFLLYIFSSIVFFIINIIN